MLTQDLDFTDFTCSRILRIKAVLMEMTTKKVVYLGKEVRLGRPLHFPACSLIWEF